MSTHETRYEHLAGQLRQYLSADELAKIDRAYNFASAAHTGQTRDEGTPYIVHPVRVAVALVDELQIRSPDLICSALLHDVIEDSPTTREQIGHMFGEAVAEVVWLLTKLEEVSLGQYLAAIEAAAETGAPIVKLCDRVDNLRFLVHSHRTDKKRRYIRTTETYYLPMALRTNRYLYDELLRLLEDARGHLKGIDPQT